MSEIKDDVKKYRRMDEYDEYTENIMNDNDIHSHLIL